MRVFADPARGAAPRRRQRDAQQRRRRAPSARAGACGRCARASACARSAAARTGSCWRPAASPPAALELDSRWKARETALGLPVAGVPAAGEERFRPGLLRRAPDRPRRRGGRRRAAAGRRRRRAGARERRWWPARRSPGAEPWREKSGDGISLATGHRAAELILSAVDRRDGRARGGRGELSAMAVHEGHDVLGDAADARVARPLRQVHDLRDVLPGLERHAAVPGPEVRRAAGRALPRRRRAVARRLARLLLGLRRLHAGLPAGRPHRRDQHAGAGEAQGDEGRPAARPRARAPDAGRPARHARRAARQLDASSNRLRAARRREG